jgi:hypothetical protein
MEGSEIGKRIQKYFESYIKIVILTAAFPTIFLVGNQGPDPGERTNLQENVKLTSDVSGRSLMPAGG